MTLNSNSINCLFIYNKIIEEPIHYDFLFHYNEHKNDEGGYNPSLDLLLKISAKEVTKIEVIFIGMVSFEESLTNDCSKKGILIQEFENNFNKEIYEMDKLFNYELSIGSEKYLLIAEKISIKEIDGN